MPRSIPWRVLVGAVLSTRTKDEVTLLAIKKLFSAARTPSQLLQLTRTEVARLIYPVGFYRTKAGLLLKLASVIMKEYHGRVPNTRKQLLTLPGVGPKVANIVLAQGFGIPAIAVDIHVHRISNRMGLVRTRTPAATEKQLTRILPVSYWRDFNPLFVALGQTICRPQKPRCNLCPVNNLCDKRGVRLTSNGQ